MLKVNVDRHKLLNALKQIEFEQFEGIVEVDETYFLYTQKGQRDITGRNSLYSTYLTIVAGVCNKFVE